MKQKKPTIVHKDSSLIGLFKIIAIGFIILVLFLILQGKDKTAKITPEKAQTTTSVCSSDSFPVCGKDGKTYTNSCTAEKIANVHVAYVGICREDTTENEKPITSLESTIIDTGTVVDSGIQNLESVPKYMTGRENTGTINTSSQNTEIIPALSGATSSLNNPIDPTLLVYFNNTYHYGFSMPKNSFYQAFGAQNGANHSIGITTGTGVDLFTNSDVRVYFYANNIVAELSKGENGSFIDTTTHTVYILLNNKDSAVIESNNEQSILVQTIIRTIHAE